MSNKKPVILVTNDDGINAKGIGELVDVVKDFGDVIVISADKSFSGMSHAITVSEILKLKEVGTKGNVHYYQTNGTPADCVKLALHYKFIGDVDYVVSGINHGSNSSINVHYSGTLGAVREGCLNGIPSVGFSLLSYDADADFTETKRVAKIVFAKVMQEGLPKGTFLNVNVPESKKIDGIRKARMTMGRWEEKFIEREDPRGGKYLWLSGKMINNEPELRDTDEYLLNNNMAAVVPCHIDVTDYKALNSLDFSDEL